MSIFEQITVKWKEKVYHIPPDQVMQLIAKVENVVTLSELSACAQNKTLPLAKLSQAFGIVLRHAGASVSDEEVYGGMFEGGDMAINAQAAVSAILVMMIPPEYIRRTEERAKGKELAARDSTSSKKRTR